MKSQLSFWERNKLKNKNQNNSALTLHDISKDQRRLGKLSRFSNSLVGTDSWLDLLWRADRHLLILVALQTQTILEIQLQAIVHSDVTGNFIKSSITNTLRLFGIVLLLRLLMAGSYIQDTSQNIRNLYSSPLYKIRHPCRLIHYMF